MSEIIIADYELWVYAGIAFFFCSLSGLAWTLTNTGDISKCHPSRIMGHMLWNGLFGVSTILSVGSMWLNQLPSVLGLAIVVGLVGDRARVWMLEKFFGMNMHDIHNGDGDNNQKKDGIQIENDSHES